MALLVFHIAPSRQTPEKRGVAGRASAGQLVAGGGSYTMTFTIGKVINGTYQVINANSAATQAPAGPAVWQRR